MMLPSNPSVGDVFTSAGGWSWTWDGARWVPAAGPGALADPPNDGISYLRRNGTWIPMTHHTVALPPGTTVWSGNNVFADILALDVGREGTWFVGTNVVTLRSVAVTHITRLWDGVTIIADLVFTLSAGWTGNPGPCGVITDPAGPLKISCVGLNQQVEFVSNQYQSYTAALSNTRNQTTLTAVRIG